MGVLPIIQPIIGQPNQAFAVAQAHSLSQKPKEVGLGFIQKFLMAPGEQVRIKFWDESDRGPFHESSTNFIQVITSLGYSRKANFQINSWKPSVQSKIVGIFEKYIGSKYSVTNWWGMMMAGPLYSLISKAWHELLEVLTSERRLFTQPWRINSWSQNGFLGFL